MRATVPLMILLLTLASLPLAAAAPHERALANHADDDDATLVVIVNATGGNASFPFTATGDGLPSTFELATVNGTARATFSDLPAGNASLVAKGLAGWTLTGARCTAGAPGNVTLAKTVTTTCWFEQAKQTYLRVTLTSLGADGNFTFLGAGEGMPSSFWIQTSGRTGEAGFVLAPGANVSVTLGVPAGWKLSSGSCPVQAIAANATRTCAFVVAKLASVRTTLSTSGGDASFLLYHRVGDAWANQTLTTANGLAWANFSDLDPDATHSFGVIGPSGWAVGVSPCANVTLGANGSLACAFGAARVGTVAGRVLNATNGQGLPGYVVFVDANGNGARDGDERHVASNETGAYALTGLAPGVHTIRVVVAPGWHAAHGAARTVNLTSGAALDVDFRIAPDGWRAPKGDEREGHERASPGGGPGYWKNWRNHHNASDVDAWVRALSQGSAWLMPAGYAETGAGAAQLLADATKGCRQREECETLRLEADYLVLRLNLHVGHRLWNETVHVNGERANATGLSGHVTLRQLVDAFEARAGHAMTDREMRAWQSLL